MTITQFPGPADEPDLPEVIDLKPYLKIKGYKRTCMGHHLEVDLDARTVICKRCETVMDPFEAMAYVARKESQWQEQCTKLRHQISELKAWNPFLKALRELEKIWRGGKRLPCCPHCTVGIRAEDLAKSGLTSASDPHEWKRKKAHTIVVR